MRAALAAALLLVSATAFAQQPVHDPEKCLGSDDSSITASFGGKIYRFRTEACRQEFLADRERFAQIYDTLLELRAAGKAAKPPRGESLVPS